MSSAPRAVHQAGRAAARRKRTVRSGLALSPSCTHGDRRGAQTGQDAVFVVELGALHQRMEVVRVPQILGRQVRHDPAREREHLLVLLRDHLGDEALDDVPAHGAMVALARSVC